MNDKTTTDNPSGSAGLAATNGSATPFLDEIHAIEMMHSDANTRMDRLLKSRGWKSTSSTPGCRWMLEKQMPNGRTLLTDTDTALRYEMENCDEEYYHPELGG